MSLNINTNPELEITFSVPTTENDSNNIIVNKKQVKYNQKITTNRIRNERQTNRNKVGKHTQTISYALCLDNLPISKIKHGSEHSIAAEEYLIRRSGTKFISEAVSNTNAITQSPIKKLDGIEHSTKSTKPISFFKLRGFKRQQKHVPNTANNNKNFTINLYPQTSQLYAFQNKYDIKTQSNKNFEDESMFEKPVISAPARSKHKIEHKESLSTKALAFARKTISVFTSTSQSENIPLPDAAKRERFSSFVHPQHLQHYLALTHHFNTNQSNREHAMFPLSSSHIATYDYIQNESSMGTRFHTNSFSELVQQELNNERRRHRRQHDFIPLTRGSGTKRLPASGSGCCGGSGRNQSINDPHRSSINMYNKSELKRNNKLIRIEIQDQLPNENKDQLIQTSFDSALIPQNDEVNKLQQEHCNAMQCLQRQADNEVDKLKSTTKIIIETSSSKNINVMPKHERKARFTRRKQCWLYRVLCCCYY